MMNVKINSKEKANAGFLRETKNYFLVCLSLISLSGIFSANATIVTVTCQNNPYHFLPVTANAVVGDTIRWVLVEGGHVVGPISPSDIPNGAAGWNAPIDAGNLSFDYVVTVEGNYHYVCHPAFPHGEDGYLVVTGATGIQPPVVQNNISFAFPNPCSGKCTMEGIAEADKIIVRDVLGRILKSFLLNYGQAKIEIDIAELTDGIYFCSIIKQGAILETRRVVKN